MKNMKKIIALVLSAFMCLGLLTACGDSEEASDETAYSGILTKIKLGMPLTKIVTLQPDGVTLNYEDDTTIWSINTDTDLMQDVSALIPENDLYYYANDSFITYYFETKKGDDEIYLNGYSEEVLCLLDRETAEEYFNKKTEELVKKHCVTEGSEAGGYMKGTEDVDMELEYVQKISASSYDLVFTMILTYDTVDGVTGYYATKFEIDVTEKSVRDEVTIDTPTGE